MFKSCVALARILTTNNFASKASAALTTQASRCRYVSDCVRQVPMVESDEKRRKIIEAEMSYWHAEGGDAPNPTEVPPDEWKNLMELKSISARKSYCRFLHKKYEAKREQREIKAIRQAKQLENRTKMIEEREKNPHIYYGFGGDSLLLRIQPRTIAKWKNRKLMRARLFGPKLIFDCSFDATMSKMEIKSAGRQLNVCFSENRRSREPFDLHLCNVDKNSDNGTLHWLQRHNPSVLDTKCPLSVHEKCFTELFPLERLVYLSPDSDNALTEYNADDIFIVGVIVDRGPYEKLSLAKAKRLGIRHASLPLDTNVRLTSGTSKRFTLNTMTKILWTWKETRDWKKALNIVNLQRKLAAI